MASCNGRPIKIERNPYDGSNVKDINSHISNPLSSSLHKPRVAFTAKSVVHIEHGLLIRVFFAIYARQTSFAISGAIMLRCFIAKSSFGFKK